TLKIPQPKASRRLADVRRSGLVATRREGLWVHYRLAPVPDPIVGAILGAVRHALTHVDVVKHDGERLQKRTGCCLPTGDDVTGLTCCAPATSREYSIDTKGLPLHLAVTALPRGLAQHVSPTSIEVRRDLGQ